VSSTFGRDPDQKETELKRMMIEINEEMKNLRKSDGLRQYYKDYIVLKHESEIPPEDVCVLSLISRFLLVTNCS
jgi:hypothetical protein